MRPCVEERNAPLRRDNRSTVSVLTPDEIVDQARPHLLAEIVAQPYPLVFVTVSGAHLYGFPSADSDFDLRGTHVTPLKRLVGLRDERETVERKAERAGLEIETVTHDIRKYFRLMIKHNGYVLEQLYSPLILCSSDEHEELKELARGCITRGHAKHYLGFAQNELALLDKRPTLKRVLYLYRVLLTGIHLMRTGDVEANLDRLNESFRLPQVTELISKKRNASEQAPVSSELEFHRREYERLGNELQQAAIESTLPDEVTCYAGLNDLLIRLRLGPMGATN